MGQCFWTDMVGCVEDCTNAPQFNLLSWLGLDACPDNQWGDLTNVEKSGLSMDLAASINVPCIAVLREPWPACLPVDPCGACALGGRQVNVGLTCDQTGTPVSSGELVASASAGLVAHGAVIAQLGLVSGYVRVYGPQAGEPQSMFHLSFSFFYDDQLGGPGHPGVGWDVPDGLLSMTIAVSSATTHAVVPAHVIGYDLLLAPYCLC